MPTNNKNHNIRRINEEPKIKCNYCNNEGRARIDPVYHGAKVETILCDDHYHQRFVESIFAMETITHADQQ